MSSVLNVERLSVSYAGRGATHAAVNDVSLRIAPGEALGLVGESGSGKSSVALAVLRYLPTNARVEASRLAFEDRELRDLSAGDLRKLRGDRIAAVYQHPGSALNPSMTIGAQISETILRHRPMHRDDAFQRAAHLLGRVRVADPERVLRLYPHELSGGMQQRANIAIAIALDPSLLVMDEPTTALDVVVQREILQKVYALKEKFNFSILFITHDLSLMVEFCDRIGIMYAGELVEVAPAKAILTAPLHPYTKGLGNSFPPLHGPKTVLEGIPGTPLNLLEVPVGCRFQARCARVHERCRQQYTKLAEIRPGQQTACHLYEAQDEQQDPLIYLDKAAGC